MFKTYQSSPIQRQHVGQALHALADALGWASEAKACLKPHSLRGGGATAAARGGASEEQIKALGRWASDAVRGYVHAAPERARDAQEAIASNFHT